MGGLVAGQEPISSVTEAILAGLVVLVGILVLTGWAFDVRTLKSVSPGFTSMKANTASSFVLAGVSLLLIRVGPANRSARIVGLALAGVVLLVGLLTTAEYALGWRLGLDQLLFRDRTNTHQSGPPGRMGLNAAVCLMLAAGSILLIASGRQRLARLAQGAALAFGTIALIAFAGYLYGVPDLESLLAHSVALMALHTSIAFLLLAVALILATRSVGVGRLLTSDNAGGIMCRRLALPALALPLLLGWLGLEGNRAGWYEREFALALVIVAVVISILLLIAITGRSLETLDRDRAEAYRRAENLAAIVESSDDAIIGLELDGTISSWNRGAEALYGYGAGEAVGRPISLLLPSGQSDELPEQLEGLVKGERSRHSETTRVHKDGRTLDVSVTISPVSDADGAVVGASKIARDVSDRVELERSLRATEAQFRTLVDNIPGAVYRCAAHPPWTVQYISDEVENITGYPASDFVDDRVRTFNSIVHPLDRERATHGDADDHPFDVEYRIVHADGSIRWVYEKGRRQFADDALSHIDGAIFDVTDQRRLQDDYRQSQKMEAIGQLAGGVAHDFNNLLTAIQGYGEMLRNKLIAGELTETVEIDEVLKASRRAASLTTQLLAFSRKQSMESRVLDLNRVVDQIGGLLKRLIGGHIEFVTVLEPGLAGVEADPTLLETMIVNLVVNARDAMPDGGRLTIQTESTSLDAGASLQRDPVKPGRYAMLAVTDTGSGIDDETLEHIFEPFFTTKPEGQGTGLGLATVHGIAKQTGAHIRVYSEPGRGTTFKIFLPFAGAGLDADNEALEPTVRGGDERILLVEDEATLRVLVKQMLEDYGYTVLVAEDGEQALELLERGEPPIDLIVSDVVMPRMGGAELARRVAVFRPGVKVLLVSGYPEDRGSSLDSFVPDPAYLQKPFTQLDLAKRVRSLLDGAAINRRDARNS